MYLQGSGPVQMTLRPSIDKLESDLSNCSKAFLSARAPLLAHSGCQGRLAVATALQQVWLLRSERPKRSFLP